jgi:catechol 2,3-dioxygenase-like lactoylglutathione lyase family enzyme
VKKILCITLILAGVLMAGPVGTLTTVAIKVNDLDASLKFYTETLGFTELYRYEFEGRQCVGLESFRLVGPKADASDLDITEPGEIGVFYLLLEVKDLDATVKSLEEKGVQFLMPITEVAGGVRFTFFLDPNGVSIMLQESFQQ